MNRRSLLKSIVGVALGVVGAAAQKALPAGAPVTRCDPAAPGEDMASYAIAPDADYAPYYYSGTVAGPHIEWWPALTSSAVSISAARRLSAFPGPLKPGSPIWYAERENRSSN